jgi:serine/threonine protein phosphatase PrpC
MGACLPTAVLSANTERHGTKNMRIGIAEVNGWRNSMEDAHVIHVTDDWAYLGVLDGHGGTECSIWCAARINEKLRLEGCPADDAAAKKLVLAVDAEFLATKQKSGSTAAMCIVRPKAGGGAHLHVVNAGDSRVLLSRADGSIVDGGGTDQGLTTDHKPDHPMERERVYRCGGTVEEAAGGVHRVNGDLAVSRGFGDAEHKKTGGPAQEDRPVTCDPEMAHLDCGATDFLLIVCDGDPPSFLLVMSLAAGVPCSCRILIPPGAPGVSEGDFHNPEVCQYVAQILKETNDPGIAAQALPNPKICPSRPLLTPTHPPPLGGLPACDRAQLQRQHLLHGGPLRACQAWHPLRTWCGARAHPWRADTLSD